MMLTLPLFFFFSPRRCFSLTLIFRAIFRRRRHAALAAAAYDAADTPCFRRRFRYAFSRRRRRQRRRQMR